MAGSDILSYQIFRATEGGAASLIQTVSATTLTYVDETDSGNQLHLFREGGQRHRGWNSILFSDHDPTGGLWRWRF